MFVLFLLCRGKVETFELFATNLYAALQEVEEYETTGEWSFWKLEKVQHGARC
jgi:hypothetical protein